MWFTPFPGPSPTSFEDDAECELVLQEFSFSHLGDIVPAKYPQGKAWRQMEDGFIRISI